MLKWLLLYYCYYYYRYEPEDQLEWSLVLEEIKGFIKAEAAVAVLHADSNPIVLSYRWEFIVSIIRLKGLFAARAFDTNWHWNASLWKKKKKNWRKSTTTKKSSKFSNEQIQNEN